MTSPEVQRLAKLGQCEGCLYQAPVQPFGPEGELLCELCCEALWAKGDWKIIAGFVMAVVAAGIGVVLWLLSR